MALYAGIDCGTQGSKVIIVDGNNGNCLGEGNAPHSLISRVSGAREQEAQWWITALEQAFHHAIKQAGINPQHIVALAVSAQQHGFVPLDAEGNVLHTVKLWCDTETIHENQQLLQQLGGEQGSLETLGLVLATGYTASKILWFKNHHPQLWQRLHTVLLPHDYLNFWLTGQRVSEYGDASGSGLFNIHQRQWDRRITDLIDNSGKLWRALPPVKNAYSIIGTLRPQVAARLGLSPKTKIATGGGDNMMAAIGSGNIAPGIITMSLGTSGTLFTCTEQPLISQDTLITNFCSSTNHWLPLICTMNATSATHLVQQLLQTDLTTFNQLLAHSPPGADGIRMLPFFNGERVPSLPHARGGLYNLDSHNFTRANLCRAVVESATYGLRYGLDLFRQQGIAINEIRLIGGGANSLIWRQIIADVMDCPVVCLQHQETAAMGAVIQAMWCLQMVNNPAQSASTVLTQLCQRFAQTDRSAYLQPDTLRRQQYQTLYQHYLYYLHKHYPEVKSHSGIKNHPEVIL